MKDKNGQTAEEWGKDQFEFEYCAECGGDWDDHDYILILGGWFARCRDENIKKAESDISWKLREQMTNSAVLSYYEQGRLQYLQYYRNQPLKQGGLTEDEKRELHELESKILVVNKQ